MKRYDLIVVGAGPAGLSAAIEAAKAGMRVAVFDENARPGGQLFKQIHKFFGSKEHRAKIRGFMIGNQLLEEANQLGVTVFLNSAVIGLFAEREITVKSDDRIAHYKADCIIIATGASENAVPFPGWTLPGVIGAGAAQTMMNLHGVLPGKKILMLGSGNVGLVVSYQLMQSGCEVVGIVDAAPSVGGYGVHASKIARYGVPFYLKHTIIKADGTDCVQHVTIAEIDGNWQPIAGSEKTFDADTVCMAVGLSPMSQLCGMAGCTMSDDPSKGGIVPVCDQYGETSVAGIYAAGDASGIEEASSAMIEGKIAGISAAQKLGFLDQTEFETIAECYKKDLSRLRQGMFSPENKGKPPLKTDEGYPVSEHLLHNGFLNEAELTVYPGFTSNSHIHPVIECTQNIPCNPCQDACPKHCIAVGETITDLPKVDAEKECTGCGLCVASCSGQAIFLIKEALEPHYASVTMPYEFLPLPKEGETGLALDRKGSFVCRAEVIGVRTSPTFDKTNLLTLKVPVGTESKVRGYKSEVSGI